MKSKKLMSIMTTAIVAAAMIPSMTTALYAAETTNTQQTQTATTGVDGTYGAQLSAKEKVFYDAMILMDKNGLFKTGTGSIDLLKNGVSADEVKAAVNGDKTLGEAFHAARDAFTFDHPGVFYVNFEKLTLRTGIQNGQPAALICSGTNANFYKAGFSSTSQVNTAITAYNKKLTTYVTNAKKKTATVDKIRSLHTQIINTVNYSTSGNYVTTPYGVVNGLKLNCQGYAKAFKDGLDELGIENMLVSGTAVNSLNKSEEHMWSYVKVDGNWYGVDLTWDDPIGGKLREDYFMRGTNTFDQDHFASGQVSPKGKGFELPVLANIGLEEESGVELNQKGFTILTEKGTDSENLDFTGFKVSFDRKGASKLQAEGKVLAMRYAYDGVNYNAWTPVAAFSRDSKDKSYSSFSISKQGKLQFAVTTLAFPRVPAFSEDLAQPQYNVGLSESVEILYIDHYIAEPMVRQSSPSVTARILPVKQKINVQFDEKMEVIDANQPVTIVVENTQAGVKSEVSEITWDNGTDTIFNGEEIGVSNIHFSFDPDKTYQGTENTYSFYVKNLRGVGSKKAAAAFRYSTNYRDMSPNCVTTKNTLFSVANVHKIADGAFDLNTFKGTKNLNTTNIVLVADKEGTTASFDLTFNCAALLGFIKPGVNMKIGVPYPTGYDMRDGNVTFKAYWFTKDENGNFVAKELQTQISEKGLEVVASPL